MLEVIPAIDLKSRKCVRLQQGRPDMATTYSENPVAIAKRWAAEGAHRLHIVDLDGAFQGKPVHSEIIKEIAASVSLPIQLGGGLRTERHIREALALGVQRVIVGTAACSSQTALAELVSLFGDKLVVGIDAKDGLVQTQGWTFKTTVCAEELARQVENVGIRTIIYTDVSRDGMLKGPNIPAVEKICKIVKCDVIAAGGISAPDHVRALASIRLTNLKGVVVGKALYDGRTTLAELMQASQG